MIMDTGQNRVGFGEPRTLGSLRSENGDVNENNEEKQASHPLKHFFAIIPSRPVTKKKKNLVGAEGRDLVGIQTEIVNFIILPFPF